MHIHISDLCVCISCIEILISAIAIEEVRRNKKRKSVGVWEGVGVESEKLLTE